MDSAPRKTKCNPAAAERNKHLCEVPSERFLRQIIYFNVLCVIILKLLCRVLLIVVFQSAMVLCQAVFMVFIFPQQVLLFSMFTHFPTCVLLSDVAKSIEFFLRQFCDAHTCTGGPKPFSKGSKVEFAVILNCSNFLFLIHAHAHLCE